VNIVLNDNKTLSGNFSDLKKTVENVDKLLALDVNNEIKRIEILPSWSGEKICKPIDFKAVDKETKKEL